MKPEVFERTASVKPSFMAGWAVILLGLAALAIPTAISLAKDHWSTEAGTHGPLVMATAGWLIWRRMAEFSGRAERGSIVVTAAMLVPALALYVFGRAFDYLSLQAIGFYLAVLGIIHDAWGKPLLRHLWFPLLYLAFALPVPTWFIDISTAPLKELASWMATEGLRLVGIPITREGVILFVAQYQLLVEDACAGMNAIMGLVSLGLFYSYLSHGPSWRHALLLTACILPIAVLANVIRIAVLVLITYWMGDEAAQGYLHGTAGLVMFASALFLVFLADSILAKIYWGRKQGQ